MTEQERDALVLAIRQIPAVFIAPRVLGTVRLEQPVVAVDDVERVIREWPTADAEIIEIDSNGVVSKSVIGPIREG